LGCAGLYMPGVGSGRCTVDILRTGGRDF